jgi:hypothetical protein
VRDPLVRAGGLIASGAYAAFIVWLHVTQPQTIAQVTGGLASSVGVYRADPQAFADGLQFFRRDQFIEARAALMRADPAERDPQTQFYIAYSYYREGWRRLYRDDTLYARGLAAVEKAIRLAPNGRLVIDDPNLGMHSADELKTELDRGLKTDRSDFNPLKVFEKRK